MAKEREVHSYKIYTRLWRGQKATKVHIIHWLEVVTQQVTPFAHLSSVYGVEVTKHGKAKLMEKVRHI